MPEKVVHFNDIGKVTIRKNKRSKNASIALKPLKGIIVNIPYYLNYDFGLNLVNKKKDWIIKHLPKIETVEKQKTLFTEETKFNTKYRTLNITKHNSDKVLTKITNDKISIQYPVNVDIENEKLQEIIRSVIIKTLRHEAKHYLPARTNEIAEKLKFKYNKLFIKNNQTLWGSCSGRNNINLNLHLMRLPGHLIDYVIIHELCHTVEKNHGQGFWKLMDSILGDAKKLSKELKKYSIQLF